jgi:hypothetical protein
LLVHGIVLLIVSNINVGTLFCSNKQGDKRSGNLLTENNSSARTLNEKKYMLGMKESKNAQEQKERARATKTWLFHRLTLKSVVSGFCGFAFVLL